MLRRSWESIPYTLAMKQERIHVGEERDAKLPWAAEVWYQYQVGDGPMDTVLSIRPHVRVESNSKLGLRGMWTYCFWKLVRDDWRK